MLRRALVLLAVLVALVALDRGQRDAAAERRQDALRVRHIVGAVLSADRPVAVVRVTDGGGHVDLYGRQDGFWRCLSYRGTPAQMDRLEQLVAGLTDAQGVVLSEHPPRPADFGLDVPSMRVLSLHGPRATAKDPESDLIASVDIGSSVVGAEGCYARIHGQPAIWTIDVDLGAITGREPMPRPSLADPAIVPAAWPGVSPRLKAVTVALPGREAYVLEWRDKEITPAEAAAGVAGFEWILKAGGHEAPAPLPVAMGFTSYLLSAPWSDVVDPAIAPKLGLDRPRALVTLQGGGTQPLQLVLGGGKTAAGRSAVLADVSRIAFEIEPAQEALLFPPVEVFAADATTNPWDTSSKGP